MITAYLAGPDVFLPDAHANAARKIAICARHGITGRAPLNAVIPGLGTMPPERAWRAIFAADIAMMEECGIIIANLTPFRGASADAGTLVELGWFLGRGLPAFGYSNAAQDFAARSRAQIAVVADPLAGVTVEGFGLADNLMITGALEAQDRPPIVLPEDGRDRAFAALDVFERCVAQAARFMASA
jgi:nucleoside 2-deoxyribosyltransferase